MVTRAKLKTRLYVLFFCTSALVIMGCVGLFFSQKTQSSYTSKITLSSRQRAIADEMGRKMLILSSVQDTALMNTQRGDMQILLTKWENAQKALLSGSEYYGTETENSSDIQALLQEVSPVFVRAKDLLSESLERNPVATNDELFRTIDDYVERMNNITGRYLGEAQSSANFYNIALVVVIAILLLLVVYGVAMVISPIVRNFQDTDHEFDNLEERLQDADRAKTEFLANMSHEVRTPLNGVIGMVEILANTRLDEEQRSYVRNIHSSANNLLELLNNVLDVAKLQSGKLELHKENFVLSDSIDQVVDVLKPLAFAKKLELMSDISSDLPIEIVQDETRLKQVLINLINNAIKFTERGEVLLTAELVNQEADFVQVKFSIRDTGIGMKPEVLENIFQSFYQADSSITKKYGGSGLGLSICKTLVQEMGGRIWVESELGVGTTFSFTIVAETSGVTQQSKLQALAGLRALVVDDNKTNLKILVKQLSAWGIQATPFNSPDLVAEISSNLHKFDFIIMDMQMPEMDGPALTQRIRKRYTKEQLPIIVLSSVGEHLMTDEYGFYNAYLTKPVKQARLMDSIIQVMGISPAERAKSRMTSGNTETRAAKSKIKVLVAQDNPLSKAVTERTLQLLGHQYELVESSKEILEKSRRDQYDLILIDTDAQAMDGVETTKQLMRMVNREHAPVIIGLSENASEAKSALISAGMDDVVSKPMHPETLQAKIHEFLEI